MPYFIYFLLLLALPIHGESILHRIGWRGASATAIIIIVVIFAVVISFFLFYYIRQHHSRKKASQQLSENLFNEHVQRFKLSNIEVDKLKALMQHEKIVEPQVIFQSISLYEKCVDKEIKKLLDHNASEEVKKEENEILTRIRNKLGFHHLALEHPLASSRNITVGQVGSIFGKNVKVPLIRRAVVVSRDEFVLTLQYNVDKEEVCHITPGDEIKFAFTRQSDSAYGVVFEVISADGSGTIKVLNTLNFRRNQLRQYIRIELSIPLKFRLVSTVDDKKSDVRRGEVVDAKMSDISGGGMSFLCERSLRVGDVILVSFSLPDERFTGISSKIKRISLQEGKTKTLYKHHIQFVSIETNKRDKIIKYIFEKQRQINQWR